MQSSIPSLFLTPSFLLTLVKIFPEIAQVSLLEFTLYIQGNINCIYSQPTLEFTSLPNKEQPKIKKVTK